MARGVEAKQYIINKLKETFSADYLGENGGKYYISAPDDGANIQMAITITCPAKEIIFPSGVKKQIFPDGYQIIFFNNKDIKQIYPDNKIVYSFYEAKTIETSFPNGVHIYKLQNGQIEKHYPDGFKEIVYPSGEIKLINQNGKIYERQNTNYDNNGALIIQREDGTKEIKFPSGAEIFEFA